MTKSNSGYFPSPAHRAAPHKIVSISRLKMPPLRGVGVCWYCQRHTDPARIPKPATDSISVERNFTEVCVFARPPAELTAPPTMRHHAETSTTTIADLMLADLRLSHHTLGQQFDGISLRSGIRCGEVAVLLFAAIDLLFRAIVQGGVPVRISAGQAGHFGSQPDALGRRSSGRHRGKAELMSSSPWNTSTRKSSAFSGQAGQLVSPISTRAPTASWCALSTNMAASITIAFVWKSSATQAAFWRRLGSPRPPPSSSASNNVNDYGVKKAVDNLPVMQKALSATNDNYLSVPQDILETEPHTSGGKSATRSARRH